MSVSVTPEQGANPRRSLARTRLWRLVALLVLLSPPLLTKNAFYLHVADLICLNAILVMGLFLVTRAGQISLCHAAFAGLGAYTSSLLVLDLGAPVLSGIVGATLVTGGAAFLIGSVTLRLRGVYFVLVTFLFGQIFNLILLDASGITRGANGIVGIPPVRIAGYALATQAEFYPFAACVAVLTWLLIAALLDGPAGRALASVEERIDLAEASGIATQKYQTLAFTLGSAIAGLGGALFAHYIRFISPDSFTFWDSVTYIVMLVVGGRGSISGALTGVIFLTPLPELLRNAEALQHVLYGAVLMLVLRFMPGGLVTLPRTLRTALTFRKSDDRAP